MALLVLINAYNEEQTIAKAIESVHDYVDHIHVFDGAYYPYPFDKPFSTDKTRQIVESYKKATFHPNTKPFDDQLQKRSSMFIGKTGDIYLRIDGDEYVANPSELENIKNNNFDVGWIWTHSNLYLKPYKTARIVRHFDGIHHAGRHHWLFDGNKNFITSDQNMNSRFKHVDTKIRMYNFRNIRPLQRKIDKVEFVHKRNVDEFKFGSELEVYKKRAHLIKHKDAATTPLKPFSYLTNPNNPEYTLSLMFSREWMIDKYFDNFKNLWIPNNTEILVIIDSKKHHFKNSIVDRLAQIKNRFNGIGYTLTGNEPLPEFEKVNLRRERIVENWNRILTEAHGTILLGGEDDSLPEPKAYYKLLHKLGEYDLVQADIIGRWGAPLHPAWMVEEKNGKPFKAWTLPHQTGISQIHGCGWYCFVASLDTMRSEPMFLDGLLPLGPDLRHGYRLHKSGKKLAHYWDVKVTHVTQKETLIPGITESTTRAWMNVRGNWVFDKSNPMR